MDAFEQVVAEILWTQGYWVRTSVKVNLTKAEKVHIDRSSSPRWEYAPFTAPGIRERAGRAGPSGDRVDCMARRCCPFRPVDFGFIQPLQLVAELSQ
jgi:hypothetical protein